MVSTNQNDVLLASIKSTFTVNGVTFDTREEAEKHFLERQKIKEASKKLECFFENKAHLRNSLCFYHLENLAEWLNENRNAIKEILVDFGAEELLF